MYFWVLPRIDRHERYRAVHTHRYLLSKLICKSLRSSDCFSRPHTVNTPSTHHLRPTRRAIAKCSTTSDAMSYTAPYTYIQCPCSDPSNLSRTSAVDAAADKKKGGDRPGARGSYDGVATTAIRDDAAGGAQDERKDGDGHDDDVDEDDDDRTFDPRAPRSNYSLYPLEHLLYCEDCHQIRCPRCVNEEIVTYYFPTCLFEVPSSNLKSEGNRYVVDPGARGGTVD